MVFSLRTLFKKRNIPNSFKGAVIFGKDDLLKFSKDLISYPFTVLKGKEVLYKDLDVSHNELPFIIRVSGHLNIDLLSTDKTLLRDIVNKNISNSFNIKEYRAMV